MKPAIEVAREFKPLSGNQLFADKLAALLERERREAGVKALEWALEHADDVGVYLDDNDHPTTGAAEIRNEIARLRAWKGDEDAQDNA